MNFSQAIESGDQISLGNCIRQARLAKYLSLEGLADQLGVSKVTVWNWENNRTRPRSPRFADLSEVLGVPVDVLMTGGDAAKQNVPELIYDCRRRIAESMGVQPDNIEIKITIAGQSE